MMKFYLLDDDRNIRRILTQIITDRELGTVCGAGSNGHEGLEEVFDLKPDIIIADLLMPEMDGITFVEHARPGLPDTAFIMLSQVSSKEMISAAYEAGVFFIQKPINSIEVENVIQKVRQNLTMKRTLQKVQELFTEDIPGTLPEESETITTDDGDETLPSHQESLAGDQRRYRQPGHYHRGGIHDPAPRKSRRPDAPRVVQPVLRLSQIHGTTDPAGGRSGTCQSGPPGTGGLWK